MAVVALMVVVVAVGSSQPRRGHWRKGRMRCVMEAEEGRVEGEGKGSFLGVVGVVDLAVVGGGEVVG